MMPERRVVLTILLLCLFLTQVASASETMMTVAKDTLLGGMVGLVLGGTLTLVVDEDNRSDTVRWGVVVGTFSGFILGIYEVTHPQDDLFGGDDFGQIETDSPLFTGWMKTEGIGESRMRLSTVAASDTPGMNQAGGWGLKIPVWNLSW